MFSRFASTSDEPIQGWLVREGQVLASLEIPVSRRDRARGLLGRDSFDGAMLIRRARSVHTLGMTFNIDVALLDEDNVVIKTLQVRRHRVTGPIWRAKSVVEAEAGCFNTWDLKIGDELEIRE